MVAKQKKKRFSQIKKDCHKKEEILTDKKISWKEEILTNKDFDKKEEILRDKKDFHKKRRDSHI